MNTSHERIIRATVVVTYGEIDAVDAMLRKDGFTVISMRNELACDVLASQSVILTQENLWWIVTADKLWSSPADIPGLLEVQL